MHIAHPASYLGMQLDQRYRLDRLIGEGASSWVFAGQDLRLERDVAIKLFKPAVSDQPGTSRERFLAEGRTLAKLVHSHVVLVYDAGENDDGLRYLVTELSGTENLEVELVQRKKLPAEECLRLLLPLMGALVCAHEHGIVHRDLKPANIALIRERRGLCAKLLDFGIATWRDNGDSLDTVRGTPAYMAPEQARGQAVSPAADVWALGVVFFRCLTGRLPFEGAGSADTMFKLVHERAPRFAVACPGLSPRLGLALDRALEPDPRRRHVSMSSFAHALTAACTQDKIELPRDPDPVGLPDFARWVSMADVDTTRPLEPEVQDPLFAPLRTTGSFLWRRRSWRSATLALPMLAILGVWLGWPQPDSVAHQVRQQRISPQPGQKQAVAIPAPVARARALTAPQPALATAPVGEAPPLAPPAASKRPGARAKPATRPPQAPPPPAQTAGESSAEKSDLVTTWNW